MNTHFHNQVDRCGEGEKHGRMKRRGKVERVGAGVGLMGVRGLLLWKMVGFGQEALIGDDSPTCHYPLFVSNNHADPYQSYFKSLIPSSLSSASAHISSHILVLLKQPFHDPSPLIEALFLFPTMTNNDWQGTGKGCVKVRWLSFSYMKPVLIGISMFFFF